MNTPTVAGLHKDAEHKFSKRGSASVEIIAGLGVRGDAHAGEKVQHLSRVKANPDQPNLRQVHLIHSELFVELANYGFKITPGQLGENITTSCLDLLALSRDTTLKLGSDAELMITGLRNPCAQIEAFAPGLLKHLAIKGPNGIIRKAGVMAIATKSGMIHVGDPIVVDPPRGNHIALERV